MNPMHLLARWPRGGLWRVRRAISVMNPMHLLPGRAGTMAVMAPRRISGGATDSCQTGDETVVRRGVPMSSWRIGRTDVGGRDKPRHDTEFAGHDAKPAGPDTPRAAPRGLVWTRAARVSILGDALLDSHAPA